MKVQENKMPLSINKINHTNSKVFSAFQDASGEKNVYSTLRYKRNHRVEEREKKIKIATAAGAIVSTLAPMIYFAKKQHGLKNLKNIFKVDYGLKEVLTLSTTSIAGGVISGIISDKKSDKKRKINEGVFQFLNATVPTALVGGAMKLIEDNTKYQNSRAVKAAAIVISLIAGMPLAAFLANIINDPKDKEPDRKLTLKDSIVNMDDALGALVVAKIPVGGLDKLLPAIFAWCGYRAGQSN